MKQIMTIKVSVSKQNELEIEVENKGADHSGYIQIAAAVSAELFQQQLLDSECQCGHCGQNMAIALALETGERLVEAEKFVNLVKPVVGKGNHHQN